MAQQSAKKVSLRQAWVQVAGGLVAFAILFALSRYSYLLFHVVAELFAVAVATAIFMITWHSRRYMDNNYVALVGVAFLFVGATAGLHMVVYKGMGVLPGATTNAATQLWLVSRFIQATAFCAAPFFLGRRLDLRVAFAAFAALTAALLATVSAGYFPTAFVAGHGLTAFKIISEIALVVLYLTGLVLLLRHRESFDADVLRALVASLALISAAEVAFTLYTDPFGLSNLVGHLLYVGSFYMVYLALVVTAIEDPTRTLFRELKQREESARLAGALSDQLNRINTAITSTLDFDAVMKNVTVHAARALGSDAIVVSLSEEGGWRIRSVYGYPDDKVGTFFDEDEARHLALAARTKEPVFVVNASQDDRVHPIMTAYFGLESLLALPLMVKAKPIGALSFHYWTPRDEMAPVEVDFARKLAAAVSLAVENARLYEAEHLVAETLQAALINIPAPVPGVDVAQIYHASPGVGRTGGDFYDVFRTDDGRVAFIIGDVCGKGIRAAATTAMVKSTVRALAYRDPEPTRVLAGTNEAIGKQLDEAEFVTAVYGVLDVPTGDVVLANAGHPDPMLCCGSNELAPVKDHDPPLGPFPDAVYSPRNFKLRHGDTLVLFTDGVLEVRRGGTTLGDEGVREVLARMHAASASQIVASLFEATVLTSDGPVADDIAIVALRYVGPGGELPVG